MYVAVNKGCVPTEDVTMSHVDDGLHDGELNVLQRRLQEMEDTHLCGICLENKRNVAFLCGHGACAQCAQPLSICHMCRKPINHKINLY